ncbi:hypothetical protein K488DRAFT_90239 [Vararia minispora EC-137]|uniref:Uncharacterized protein n=1 Tax=Vararia minispora EC-137 TaxID=1314806 RepID=A0ACB8Q9Q7_9AGAM|nr:hypothetical protein K488DRAFT_90239 [Vararia minispora EC-137]
MFGYSPHSSYASANPYSTGYGYGYPTGYGPYADPYEAQLRRETLARQRALAEQRARALAEERLRQQQQRTRRPSRAMYSYYDPADDEMFDLDPYAQRRRELEQAQRLREMYSRAARGDHDDELETNEGKGAQREEPSIPVHVRTPSPSSTHCPNAKPPSPAPFPSPHPSSIPRTPSPTSSSPQFPSQSHQSAESRPAPSQQPTQLEAAISIVPTRAAHTAASTIQRGWRKHHALTRLADIRTRFAELGKSFEPPEVLEYTLKDMRAIEGGREEIASIRAECVPYVAFARKPRNSDEESEGEGEVEGDQEKVPQLAYTKATFAVHSLSEQYMRLLNDLDAVSSWGDREVRYRRRALAREIEEEAGRLEEWWKEVWRAGGKEAEARILAGQVVFSILCDIYLDEEISADPKVLDPRCFSNIRDVAKKANFNSS